MNPPTLGQLITDDAKRDAVHVAIAPVTAGEPLGPGFHVGVHDGYAYHDQVNHIGVVDPFLPEDIREGDCFYIFLYPNTITDMRHMWTHPAFAPTKPPKTERYEPRQPKRIRVDD